jgi:gamma-glutamylcyclotransferase (GGCT)/AIG2-like uncharacterized protein YtfP
MATIPYFAYGSNLEVRSMAERAPGAVPDGVAALKDWHLTFRGVADIEPAPGRRVWGALWLLTAADARNLDHYEGVADGFYRRVDVTVDRGDTSREAFTYVMDDQRSYLGAPSAWYLATIKRGYEHFGLPLEELERAAADAYAELAQHDVTRLVPHGRKRLRGVVASSSLRQEQRTGGA